MSSLTDLKNLKAGEDALRKIEGLLNDQLNRLKVEELSLMNQIKAQNEEEEAEQEKEDGSTIIEMQMDQTESGMNDEDINKQPLIDLVKTVLASTGGEVEEEEDDESDEDEMQDDLTRFVSQLTNYS